MKLTKYQHACFTLEKDGKVLVVDPGNFSSDFIAPENVVGIIVTHEHPDHFDREHLATIVDKNPDAVIIAHPSITAQIGTFQTMPVQADEKTTIGPFGLEFFGGEHATIHPSIPVIANLGVMVDSQLYYPGDSLTVPTQAIDVLALPVSAPWLKISEAIDFLIDTRPRLAFPTHDAILSDAGKSLVDRLLTGFTSDATTYQRINESIDI